MPCIFLVLTIPKTIYKFNLKNRGWGETAISIRDRVEPISSIVLRTLVKSLTFLHFNTVVHKQIKEKTI